MPAAKPQQESTMPYQNKDPMVELEEIARETADKMVDAIVWTAKSEAEARQLVQQMLVWMSDELTNVYWSDYKNSFGDHPYDLGFMIGRAIADEENRQRIRDRINAGALTEADSPLLDAD
jgi:hypothetical protein